MSLYRLSYEIIIKNIFSFCFAFVYGGWPWQPQRRAGQAHAALGLGPPRAGWRACTSTFYLQLPLHPRLMPDCPLGLPGIFNGSPNKPLISLLILQRLSHHSKRRPCPSLLWPGNLCWSLTLTFTPHGLQQGLCALPLKWPERGHSSHLQGCLSGLSLLPQQEPFGCPSVAALIPTACSWDTCQGKGTWSLVCSVPHVFPTYSE